MRLAAPAVVVALLSAACGSSSTPTVLIQVTSGLETSALAAPGITRVELRVRGTDGTEKAVASGTVDAGGLDVPDAARTGIGALALVGVGADGSELAYGRTPPLDLTGLDAFAPTIFVQRPGLARALNLTSTPVAPRAGMLGVRYLAIVEPTSTDVELVDLLTWRAQLQVQELDVMPSEWLLAGSLGLAIASDGTTSLVDFDAGGRANPSLPTGLALSDVAGGRVIAGDDGAAYLVGATRASGATDRVLRLDPSGTLSATTMLAKRAGATAAWLPGRGLVVVGGAQDTSAAGAEILASGASAASPLPFAADATTGAVGVLVDAHTMLRARADGSLDRLDFSCASACAPTPVTAKLGGASLDAAPLERGGVAFVTSAGLVGVNSTGTAATPIGTAPGALALAPLPNGVVGVISTGDGVLRTVR